jgi:hypothetical protein
MGGLNISAGSFQGADKSGSAFEGVLDALEGDPDLIEEIRSGFDDAEYLLISEEQVARLLPLLVSYRKKLVSEIGHDDWSREAEAEEAAGLDATEAKWGAGRGWKLYCVTDLIRACEIGLLEHEPVAVVMV